MIILDTNAVSELMRPTPDRNVQRWLTASGDQGWTTTVITLAEIEYGLRRLPPGRRQSDLMSQFEILADLFSALPLDEASALQAGRFRALREQKGLAAHPSDMLIAGIVSVCDATLATRNIKDFSDLPIDLINPWDDPPTA